MTINKLLSIYEVLLHPSESSDFPEFLNFHHIITAPLSNKPHCVPGKMMLIILATTQLQTAETTKTQLSIPIKTCAGIIANKISVI